MYEQIQRNVNMTRLIIFLFVALLLVLGYALGELWGTGPVPGLLLGALIAAIGSWTGYYYSDRIVLSISGARPVTKEEYPYLYNVIEGLALAAGVPTPRAYVIDDSAPNAFATGRDPEHAAICVTTGLLQKLNRLELEGVIAHEMSHIKNYDIRLMTIVVVMVGTITLLSDWILRSMWYSGGGHRRRSRDKSENGVGAVLLLIGIVLAMIAPVLAQLMRFALSRRREFLADADGALLTRYPEGLASALEKIAADTEPLEAANRATAHLYIVNPLKGTAFEGLYSTHPPIEARIKALRAM